MITKGTDKRGRIELFENLYGPYLPKRNRENCRLVAGNPVQRTRKVNKC